MTLEENPLGPAGAFWIVRYLMEMDQPCTLFLKGCRFQHGTNKVFNLLACSGKHTIRLKGPYDFVVLKALNRMRHEGDFVSSKKTIPDVGLEHYRQAARMPSVSLTVSKDYSSRPKQRIAGEKFRTFLSMTEAIQDPLTQKCLFLSLDGEYGVEAQQLFEMVKLMQCSTENYYATEIAAHFQTKLIDATPEDATAVQRLLAEDEFPNDFAANCTPQAVQK